MIIIHRSDLRGRPVCKTPGLVILSTSGAGVGTDICEDCLQRLCVKCLDGPRDVGNLCERCAIQVDRETMDQGYAR